jgi:hypothetical protein
MQNATEIPGHPNGSSDGIDYAYKIYLSHLRLRYQPSRTAFAPYVEALVGVKWLFTEKLLDTHTTVPIYTGGTMMLVDTRDSENVLSRVAPSYGVGAGLKLRLFPLSSKEKGHSMPASLYLHLQGRYLFGGQARYLREGGIHYEDSQRHLDVLRSRTDMLFFNIGLAVQG